MRLRGLVLVILVLLVVFVVGGNLYLRSQVKKTFYSQVSRWEEQVNRGFPPEQRVEVKVEAITPSFSLLPFFSPSNSFVIKGLHLVSPRGEVTLRRLVGTAVARIGRVESIKLAVLEGLEARDKEGVLEVGVRRITFSPAVDIRSFFGWVSEPTKEVGGRLEGLTASFMGEKGGEVDVSVREASFKQKMALGKREEVPPGEPFRAHTVLKSVAVAYRELGDEKCKGKAVFDYMSVESGLSRGEGDTTYTFWEDLKTQLSRLEVPPPKKAKKKVAPGKLLPLQGEFQFRLANLSEELVSSTIDLMRSLRNEALSQQQRLAMFIQFLQKNLPPFMEAVVEGEAQLTFPLKASVSAEFQSGVVQLLSMKRNGNPLWITVKVKGKNKLLSLLSQAGIKDQAVEEFFAGLECQEDLCRKKIPLGGAHHRF
ncbi:MAG: hypothetical protein DRI92_01155 [Aquificota bacterium]|nr:MAG: hypothetical protein DRI92_01155 [Aquificota bacterium]